jgi:hypothetical protein
LDLLPVLYERLHHPLRLRHSLDHRIEPLHERGRLPERFKLRQSGSVYVSCQEI